MLTSRFGNFLLSKVNIEKLKHTLGRSPVFKPFYKLGSQSLIDYQYPTHLFIETTRACNLGCVCCPRTLKTSQMGHMDVEIFKKIINEATGFGVKNFSLHMLGEPLLHPKIIDMVKYIKQANNHHSILLTTNGYFLNKIKAQALLENKVDKVAISVFSLKEEVNKKITGKGDISAIIENIKVMSQLKKEMHAYTQIYIRMIVDEYNETEIPQFKEIAKDLGIKTEIRYTGNFGGIIKENYTDNKHLIKKRYPCYHLWFSPAVTWDGKIVICCVDWKYSEVLGDIRETNLATVWQGNRMKQLRTHHLKGEYHKIPICAGCNVWSTYPDIFFNKQKADAQTFPI